MQGSWRRMEVIKYIAYLGRWQLSGLVLAPVLYLFGVSSVVLPTIIANLIGGAVFFWVDRWIFKDGRK